MNMPDINVAITGFGGLNNPDSGAAVSRAIRLGRPNSVSISALGYDWMMTGAWMSGIADQLYLMPLPNAGDAIVLDRVLGIHKNRKIDALIPSLETDVPVFARLAEQLIDAGIRVLLPDPESIYAITRAALPTFLFHTGIPALDTKYIADIDDVPEVADQLGYPLTVMGTVLGAVTVYSANQARQAAASFNAVWGGGAVLQRRIDGDEFSVAVLTDSDSTCSGIVAIRKLAVNDSGHTECGCVVQDPQLEEIARKIVAELNWRGPLEIEFVRPRDALDPLLSNIRCCFPQWITQSHFADCNLPVRLLDNILTKADRDTGRPTAGTMFIRGIEEAAIPLDNLLHLRTHGTAAGVRLNGHRHKIAGDFVISNSSHGLTVAVTGISTFDLINPGLGTARALSKHPDVDRIIGLNYGTFDSGSFQHEIFDAAFKLPITHDKDVLFERIREIHAAHPFEVLIPCLDGELPSFIALQESIESLGIKMLLPSQDAFERREKIELFGNQLEKDWNGFRIPHGILASSEAEVIDAAETIGFPVVVKGPIFGCYHAYTIDDARSAWWQLIGFGIEQVIVQDRIDGEMFAVAAVCDRDHKTLDTLTIKKLARCERGSTWSGLRVNQPALESALEHFLEYIEWVGPVEGEFVRDYVRDEFYLFEVNPRFTGWISYSSAAGCNHPYLAVSTALDREPDLSERQAEVVFMRSTHDLPVRASDFAALSLHGKLLKG
jgi:carbamoyl-phosphate synthase large subunit